MIIGPEEVRRIAHLARLAIDAKDVNRYAQNLSDIFGFVAQMDAVDTSAVEAMAHPQDATQRLRPDDVTESDQRELFLSNAPLAQDGLYLVPRVIE